MRLLGERDRPRRLRGREVMGSGKHRHAGGDGPKLHVREELEARVHRLELEWGKHRTEIDRLESLVENLRTRLNALLPERTYCKHCKALISPLSEVCGSCGKVLRVPANPKAGQPR